MTPQERLLRLRLARTPGVGPFTFRRLLARFGTAAAAVAGLPEFAQSGGRLGSTTVTSAEAAEREMAEVAALGGRLLMWGEPDYPRLLAMVDDAPPVLAVLGDPAVLARPSVAIVGARNASANGYRLAELLAADLAARGMVVVSGLARGVDTAAHGGAMQTGVTVAAVAGGLDRPYPPENAGLQAQIAAAGAVVAEAPIGTAPMSRHFPRRNRIIAGLSQGVVVIEAARYSGSLITAQHALDTERLVMAVPGSPLDPRNAGSNDLLRAGAALVSEAAHVLDALASWHPPAEAPAPALGFAEPQAGFAENGAAARAGVLAALAAEPSHIDDLVRRCHLSAPIVMAAVTGLELDGMVETLPGNRVALLV